MIQSPITLQGSMVIIRIDEGTGVGDVLRRKIGGTFCREQGKAIAEYFQSIGQFGVSVPGGSEAMAMRATLGYQQKYAVLTYDAKNAFNSMRRRAILPAVAKRIPSLAPYALNLYAREPPQFLYKTVTGETEIISSRTGVQQGCNLGPLCYSIGAMDLLREFRDNPPVADAQILSFIDDVTVILPPREAQNATAVQAFTVWLQQGMEPLGIALKLLQITSVVSPGTCVDQWPAEDRAVLARSQLTVASQGLRVVGIPVGEEDYIKQEVRETTTGEPATLLRELAQMEDAQASLQILCLSAITRLNFYELCPLPERRLIRAQGFMHYSSQAMWLP